MNIKNKTRLRAGDFAIFAVIIAFAVLIWIRYAMIQTDRVYGEIWQDGKLKERIALADNYHNTVIIKGKSYDSTIEIDGKRMRFINAHCPDKTCERTGWVEKVGGTAVCLPNRVMIKIVSADENTDNGGVDVVVR